MQVTQERDFLGFGKSGRWSSGPTATVLSRHVIRTFSPRSDAAARVGSVGEVRPERKLPCFEKQSSLLPSPPSSVRESRLSRSMLSLVVVAAGVDTAAGVAAMAAVAAMVVGSAVVTAEASPVDTAVLAAADFAAVGLRAVGSEVVQSAHPAAECWLPHSRVKWRFPRS